MRRIELLSNISSLYEYKTMSDLEGNEFVLLRSCAEESIDFPIADKTAFEAVENHVHVIDKIKSSEISELVNASQIIGQSILRNLGFHFPEKSFFVFISMTPGDSLIIRFHQKWHSETPYYDPQTFTNTKDIVLMFES